MEVIALRYNAPWQSGFKSLGLRGYHQETDTTDLAPQVYVLEGKEQPVRRMEGCAGYL